MVSECVLVNVIQCPVLWRIIDFLLFATLPLLLSGLFGGGKTMNWCAAAAVLIFRRSTGRRAAFLLSAVCLFCYLAGGANLFLRAKRYERAALPSAYYTVTGYLKDKIDLHKCRIHVSLQSQISEVYRREEE